MAGLVLAAGTLASCASSETVSAARLFAEPESRAGASANARVRLAVQPARRRLCFRFSRRTMDQAASAAVRGLVPGRERPASLTLFKGRRRPRSACRRGPSVAVLRGLVRSPSSFTVVIRRGRELPPLRGRLGRALGTFETRGFGQFDAWSSANGLLSVTRQAVYSGRWAARAANEGSGNQFQRVWFNVDWRNGTNAWYGMALFVPRVTDWCWWTPIRWDNFATYGSAGDVGGLTIENGLMHVDQGTYASQHSLTAPVRVPEGRWFWVEIHQRLSPIGGEAATALYLNGRRVAHSNAANTAGRPIDQLRFGNVAMESGCSQRSAIYFDRVSLTGERLGPLRRGSRRRTTTSP